MDHQDTQVESQSKKQKKTKTTQGIGMLVLAQKTSNREHHLCYEDLVVTNHSCFISRLIGCLLHSLLKSPSISIF